MSNSAPQKPINPPQPQNRQPGIESEMHPLPIYESDTYKAAGKLKGKTAIITGVDSGIGRAVSVAFAKEGADIAIVYLNEHEDAKKTKEIAEKAGAKCLLIAGDIGDEAFCKSVMEQTISEFGKLDILVNNAAEQHVQQKLENITSEQLTATFHTNVFSMFYLTIVA